MPKMSEKWVRDSGLVFTLILLIAAYRGHTWAFPVCGLFLLALLFAPKILWPFGYAWYLIAELLARVMNKIFFGIVFFTVITPIGWLRRTIKGDERDRTSHPELKTAFITRSGIITARQMERPY